MKCKINIPPLSDKIKMLEDSGKITRVSNKNKLSSDSYSYYKVDSGESSVTTKGVSLSKGNEIRNEVQTVLDEHFKTHNVYNTQNKFLVTFKDDHLIVHHHNINELFKDIKRSNISSAMTGSKVKNFPNYESDPLLTQRELWNYKRRNNYNAVVTLERTLGNAERVTVDYLLSIKNDTRSEDLRFLLDMAQIDNVQLTYKAKSKISNAVKGYIESKIGYKPSVKKDIKLLSSQEIRERIKNNKKSGLLNSAMSYDITKNC